MFQTTANKILQLTSAVLFRPSDLSAMKKKVIEGECVLYTQNKGPAPPSASNIDIRVLGCYPDLQYSES